MVHTLCLFRDQYKYPEIFVLTKTWFIDWNVRDIPLYNAAYYALQNCGRSGGVSIFSKTS